MIDLNCVICTQKIHIFYRSNLKIKAYKLYIYHDRFMINDLIIFKETFYLNISILTMLFFYILSDWYYLGFGHELVKRLDQLGFTVFAGCLSEKSTGAQDLRKTSSRRVHILKLDVTKSEDIERATETVRKICKGAGKVSYIILSVLPKFNTEQIILTSYSTPVHR